jgi:hypothetical protein
MHHHHQNRKHNSRECRVISVDRAHGLLNTTPRLCLPCAPQFARGLHLQKLLKRMKDLGTDGGGGGGGGGESFPRVDWVAVPKALRARRVNRRRGQPTQRHGGGTCRQWNAGAGKIGLHQIGPLRRRGWGGARHTGCLRFTYNSS